MISIKKSHRSIKKSPRLFLPVVERAKEACKNSGQQIADHFEDILDMVSIGSNAVREVKSVKLSRYACYLIDARKSAHSRKYQENRKSRQHEKFKKEMKTDYKVACGGVKHETSAAELCSAFQAGVARACSLPQATLRSPAVMQIKPIRAFPKTIYSFSDFY